MESSEAGKKLKVFREVVDVEKRLWKYLNIQINAGLCMQIPLERKNVFATHTAMLQSNLAFYRREINCITFLLRSLFAIVNQEWLYKFSTTWFFSYKIIHNKKEKNLKKTCELLDAFYSDLLFLVETEQLIPETHYSNL